MNTAMLHRISVEENLFVIYKFSSRYPYIKTIHTGKAFDKFGDYSAIFKKLKEKYGLQKERYTFETTDSYEEFLSRVFLENTFKQIIPDNCLRVFSESPKFKKYLRGITFEETKESQRTPPFSKDELLEEIEKELDKI